MTGITALYHVFCGYTRRKIWKVKRVNVGWCFWLLMLFIWIPGKTQNYSPAQMFQIILEAVFLLLNHILLVPESSLAGLLAGENHCLPKNLPQQITYNGSLICQPPIFRGKHVSFRRVEAVVSFASNFCGNKTSAESCDYYFFLHHFFWG